MHILLLILKILGIILGSILGLVLLLLIILLAVPIRYNFELKAGDEQELSAKAGVHWLLYLISVRASYIEKKISYYAKLCGVQLVGNQPEFLKKKEEKQKKKDEKELEKEKAKSCKKEKAEKPAVQETPIISETEAPKESIQPEPREETVQSEPEIWEEAVQPESELTVEEEDKASILDRIRGIPEWLKEKLITVSERIKLLIEKIKSLYHKISDLLNKEDKEEKEDGKLKQYKALYDTYQANGTVAFVLKYVKKILKHVLPRKMDGYLRIGMDDPSTTGYITAAAAVLFPVYGKSFSFEPNFFEKELDVSLKGRGRIRLGYFVYVGIRLILKKNVRQLIKDIRNN